MLRLFHFSDRDDLDVFVPRAPLRHPDAEPLVYAIDEPHSPLYLFPRDCPRIGVWPEGDPRSMRLLIDRRCEAAWRGQSLFRYEFDPRDGFVDCHDHGVWIAHETVRPVGKTVLRSLPREIAGHGLSVEIVASLAQASREFFDPIERRFTTSLHVSMIRMSLLPDWDGEAGTPVLPE